MIETSNQNKSRIGDIVEYKAVAWLLSQGNEVFKNTARTGPVDMIILPPDSVQCVFVDVKKVVDGQRRDEAVYDPARTEVQTRLNVQFLYYNEKHDVFAWTIPEIYDSLGREKRERVIETVNIDDTTFTSIAAACKHYGCKERTVREWMKRHPGGTVPDAISHALARSKGVVVNGVQYDNKKQVYETLGISQHKVEYWHYNKHLSYEDAINIVIERG